MKIINEIFNDELIRHLAISVFLYVFLSIIVTSITGSFLNIMLGWNIILAFVPVFFAYIFMITSKKENKSLISKLKLIIIFLVWLLFFPNSYYVITDFIHLGGEEFYYSLGMYSGWIYTDNFLGYLTLTHIFLGAFIAVFMASYSLKIIHSFLIVKYKKNIAIIILFMILTLSSIGIYIGRFLRLQSWDVFRFINIIKQFIQSLDVFAFQYILIFTVIQIALYYFTNPFINIENSRA